MDLFSLDNINIDALQPLQDIFPDGWFDDVRQLYGESLSDEMISQSVEETCDFFHIDEPAIVLRAGLLAYIQTMILPCKMMFLYSIENNCWIWEYLERMAWIW